MKTIVFTIFVPGTVGLYIPYRMRPPGPYPLTVMGLAGGVLALAGAAIYLWCAWDFASFGRGTPLPLDAPNRLVARGLYRFVRNPMYVGVLSVIFGQAMAFASAPTVEYGLAVLLFFHLFVRLYEEPTLRRQFDGSYEEYCKRVPRWIPTRIAKAGPAG